MSTKSFVALLALALSTLLAIVVWAAFGPGVDHGLAKAEALIRAGALLEAVQELDLTARSLHSDPVRRDRLLRLRYPVNTELGATGAALDDIDELLRYHAADEDLQLDRIRLLALTDDGRAARSAATAFLAAHPRHSRGLELAGETCQKLYQPQLAALRSELERDLGPALRQAALGDLLAHVYRPDGDPQVAAALRRLQDLYANDAGRLAAWPARARALQDLRSAVQEALRWFEQSLEAGGRPVAAFRGVAFALEQAQRLDDLLFECELQRRQFDHDYVLEAGAIAAWALLRSGLPAAAAATVARWLPPDELAAQIAAGRANPSVDELLLARIQAAWQMNDRALLMQCWRDADARQKAKIAGPLVLPMASAILQHVTDFKDALNTLKWASDQVIASPLPPYRIDPLPGLAALRLQRLRPEDEAGRADVLRIWATARPDSIEPHLALASQLAAAGEAAAARAALQKAMAIDATDPRLFERSLELAREQVRGTAQDGAGLLAQCIRRGKTEPEVLDPLGHLLCAEAALVQKAWPIALGSAQAACRAFPRERLPRRLEAAALAGAGRLDLAQRALERLLQGEPDLATLQLARTVQHQTGQPMPALLGRLLRQSPPDFDVQYDMLQALRAAPAARAAQFVPPSTNGGPVPLRALGARLLARAGDATAAAPMLDLALQQAEAMDPICRDDFVAAIAACAIAAADAGEPDAAVAAATVRRLAAVDVGTAAEARHLLAAARTLHASHPRTAQPLLETSLPLLEPADRCGADFAIAARLATRLGLWHTAEEHATAALAFVDGAAAAEPLAHLLLAQGRLERARTVLLLANGPTDGALVQVLFGAEAALPVIAAALPRDPADLLVHGVLALAGQPTMTDWQPATGEAARERLELLAALAEPGLAPLVLPRVRALAEREPTSRTTRMLLARALGNAGLGRDAAAVHAALHAEGIGDPVFCREVAMLASADGYAPPPALLQELLQRATTNALGGSPVTHAFAARELERAFRAAGQPELADQTRLVCLRADPAGAPLTAADLDVLTRKGSPSDIVHVLDAALAGPFARDRGAWLDRRHRAAMQLLRNDIGALPTVMAAAQRDLVTDGARGPIVAVLLHGATNLDEKDRRALLLGHVQLVAIGNDDGTELDATLDAWQALDGQPAVLAGLEERLREHPTALPLWLARARRLADTPDGARALADLRAVLAHAEAPAVLLGFLILAAESGRVEPHDIARMASLQTLHGTPDGAYAAALYALRIGQVQAAELAFGLAGPQRNGMHLFGRALAILQGTAEDGPARAKALLDELRRDYPSSSAARNAGTFANQLAGR